MDLDAYERFDHGSWRSIAGVGVGYGLILTVIFVLFFLVPYLVFAAL